MSRPININRQPTPYPDLNQTGDDVWSALENLNRYNHSLHRAFIGATCVAAISTLAAVALAIDKWL